jgi:hypothetical protein
MALATIVASVTSFYLYRWRRIITSEQALFAPEELILRLRSLSDELERHGAVRSAGEKEIGSLVKNVGKKVESSASVISDLLRATTTWQQALDERDAEIRRLRSGYDLQVFGKFVGRFIRAKLATDEFLADGDFSQKSFDHVRRLLADALEECGVEEFSPKVGDDFRAAEGVEDSPRVIETANAADAFRIMSVLSPGYRYVGSTESAIIVPARVSIAMHKA